MLGKEFMRTFQTMPEVKAIPKENAKGVMPFASYVMNNDVKLRGKEALELTLPFDELSMLSDRKDVIVHNYVYSNSKLERIFRFNVLLLTFL